MFKRYEELETGKKLSQAWGLIDVKKVDNTVKQKKSESEVMLYINVNKLKA